MIGTGFEQLQETECSFRWDSRHLCPGLHAAAKLPIFRLLRKIVGLTIFCGARDLSLFFVMLIITKPERVADLTKFAKTAKNL